MHLDTHLPHEHKEHHNHKEAHILGKILCIRPQSGLSGDMLLTGLSVLSQTSNAELVLFVDALNLGITDISLAVEQKIVNGITGYFTHLHLPHEHAHRNLNDITNIIHSSQLTDHAKDIALQAFTFLAEAEAKVHNSTINEVHFHEVGALDSIIDTCLCAALFDKLNTDKFVCGPLPIADGVIHCAHGLIPAPAPAVLYLLENVSVVSTEGKGEMVTPTAISLLKAMNAEFGTWASMTIEKHALVYGSRIIPNIPNGAIFALGFNR